MKNIVVFVPVLIVMLFSGYAFCQDLEDKAESSIPPTTVVSDKAEEEPKNVLGSDAAHDGVTAESGGTPQESKSSASEILDTVEKVERKTSGRFGGSCGFIGPAAILCAPGMTVNLIANVLGFVLKKSIANPEEEAKNESESKVHPESTNIPTPSQTEHNPSPSPQATPLQ